MAFSVEIWSQTEPIALEEGTSSTHPLSSNALLDVPTDRMEPDDTGTFICDLSESVPWGNKVGKLKRGSEIGDIAQGLRCMA